MAWLPEWIRKNERVITAEEVKKLSEGKRVKLIGSDIHGEMQWIEGYVSKKGRMVQYYDSTQGGVREKLVRDYHGKAWVIEK